MKKCLSRVLSLCVCRGLFGFVPPFADNIISYYRDNQRRHIYDLPEYPGKGARVNIICHPERGAGEVEYPEPLFFFNVKAKG